MSIDAGRRPAGLPAELEDLRHRVVMLAETLLPAARAADELIDAVAAIEALKSTLDAFERQVVAELEGTGAVKPLGWASTKDFCTAVIGGHRGSGPAMVRLAEDVATPRFAPVAVALRDGWLSTTKAMVITRAVNDLPSTADHERGVAVLLDEAKRLDATELRRAGRHLLTVLDPSGADRRDEAALCREARTAHDRRVLSITEDGYGGAWLRGRCSAEDAAIVKSTLFSLASPQPAHACDPNDCSILGCSHDGRDPRDHGARLLDALVETCRRVQTANLLPDAHGATPRLTLLMHHDALRARLGDAVTDIGIDLEAGAVRRLCCDAEVIPVVLGGPSEVLDVGRLARLVTAPIWKALVARDRHCRFPGCTRPPVMCHAHHVVHWVDGGPTSVANMLLLCGHHHRLVHSSPWQVGFAADGRVVFTPPPGAVRRRPPRPPRAPQRE